MQTIAEPGALAFSCRTGVQSSGDSWAAFQKFVTARCGAVAVETALTVNVLVCAFRGLAEIVGTIYVGDTVNRTARAVALVPDGAASHGHSKRRTPAGPSRALRPQVTR